MPDTREAAGREIDARIHLQHDPRLFLTGTQTDASLIFCGSQDASDKCGGMDGRGLGGTSPQSVVYATHYETSEKSGSYNIPHIALKFGAGNLLI